MKVIYVSFSRLTDRIIRDRNIDYLIEKGVTVEYWDVVSLIREEHNDAGMQAPPYLHIVRSFSELEAMLCLTANRDAFYIIIINYEGRFTNIYRLLSKYDCRMLYFDVGARPFFAKSKLLKILEHLHNPWMLLKLIYYIARAKLYRRLKLVKPFNIVFAAGSVLIENKQYSTKVVPINSCDYDHYMKTRSEVGRIVKDRYAVYLDIYLPYHNDLRILGYPAVNPDTYHRSLNRFFRLLEFQYGIKVVIAAHPISDYGTETFEGRQIYRLQTAELVKDADFVISMSSTSTSYAVLNHKPIIFIYTKEMLSLYKETIIRDIRAFSSYLASPVYNVDEITQGEQIVIKDVAIKYYVDYKYSFLTSHESEHTTTQEILFHEINAV